MHPSQKRQRLGATAPTTGSPLPQEYATSKVTAVRIVGGFSQFLPGRDRVFFQRFYFVAMPKPIMQAAGLPFPFPLQICRIQAPQRQGIVIRSADFQVYEHSGIGVDNISRVPSAKTASYFGFDLKIGNRGMTDFNTNIVPNPGIQQPAVSGGNAAPAGTRAGQGQLYPVSGLVTPEDDINFATYARPGDEIDAKVLVLRLPNYDVRLFSVKLSGWLAAEVELDRMVDSLTR